MVRKIAFILFNVIPFYIISTIGLGYGWKLLYSDNADNINGVLLNLSYSYVAGLVFYWSYNYFPEKRSQRKSFLIISPYLKDICRQMENLIEKLLMAYDIEKDISILTLNDLNTCTYYKPEFKKIYYQEYLVKCNITRNLTKGVFDFWGDLEEYSKKIEKRINVIKNTPTIRFVDSSIIVLLSKLEQNKLLKEYQQFVQYPSLFNEAQELYEFPEKFYDLICLYSRLKRTMQMNSSIKKFRKLSKLEIEEMDTERFKVMTKLKDSGYLKNDALIYFNNYQYRIRNGELV